MLDRLGLIWEKITKPKYDDDVIDRLNYVYTNIIIISFALTIAAKSFIGEPLQCWVPAQFKVLSILSILSSLRICDFLSGVIH